MHHRAGVDERSGRVSAARRAMFAVAAPMSLVAGLVLCDKLLRVLDITAVPTSAVAVAVALLVLPVATLVALRLDSRVLRERATLATAGPANLEAAASEARHLLRAAAAGVTAGGGGSAATEPAPAAASARVPIPATTPAPVPGLGPTPGPGPTPAPAPIPGRGAGGRLVVHAAARRGRSRRAHLEPAAEGARRERREH